MKKFLNHFDRYILFLIGFVCLIILCISIFGGRYIQVSGDDFQLARLADSGPLDYFDTFLSKLNGRFTYALVGFVLYQAPTVFVHLTPVFFYTILSVGFYVFTKNIIRLNRPYIIATLAVIFSFCLSMLQYTNFSYYQTIYWLPAYLAYGLPLGALLYLLAYLYKVHQNHPTLRILLYLFASSLIIGGLHELVAILGIILGFCVLFLPLFNTILLTNLRIAKDTYLKSIIYLASITLGFMASVIINYLLPATAFRRDLSIKNPESKRTIITQSWQFTIDLFNTTVSNPLLLFCMLCFILGGLLIVKDIRLKLVIHPVAVYVSLFLSLAVPFIVLFLTTLMSRYGQAQNPPERVYLPFYFTILLGVSIAGILLAVLASQRSKIARDSTISVLCILVTVFSIPLFLSHGKYVWDFNSQLRAESIAAKARDKDIRAQIAKGERTVHIKFFTTLGDTPYPKNDKDYWFNYELARYYKIDYVIAD
jgi:hypothetical protein